VRMQYLGLPAALAGAALAALLLAPGVGATPPVPAPINGTATYAAGEVCPFPVRVEPEINKALLHVLRNGTWVVTGRLTQSATNLRTGTSRTFKSGPLHIVFNDDGTLTFISLGQVLWTSVEGDVDGPGLRLFTGHVVIQTSADGFATSISRVPRIEDVCAELG
jgi:hypothetical protein